MREINKLIVHCTATPEFKDFTLEDVRGWHVKGNGWSDIGYHYLIKLDGTVELGRPVKKPGAHVAGHNKDSIGIAYVGGMDNQMEEWIDTRTDEQKDSLFNLTAFTALTVANPKLKNLCITPFGSPVVPDV